jgi:acetoin utilization deacetylase AcuC-like enzyme
MRFIYSSAYVADIGKHVFPTRKFALTAELLHGSAPFVEPAAPSRQDLLLAHAPAWVEKVLSGKMSLEEEIAMELPFSPAVSRAHRLQVSGTIMACQDALESGVGLHVGGGSHHAFADHGEGFCVLNDIACGIRKAGRRAAVIDLDVHQGNGTASIFAGDSGIFTFSMHQQSLYPLVKPPSSLDVPLPDGLGDEDYLELLRKHLPRVFEHKPELIVYQAGVDCAAGDLLGGLRLSPEGLRWRDVLVRDGARAAGVPVAVTLGGGYAADINDTARLHAQTILLFAGKS